MRPTFQMIAGAAMALFLSSQAHAQSSGVTSGPAVGSPATTGTGGQSTATEHQTDVLRNHGGAAVSNEQAGQTGGTGAMPGASDAGAGPHPGQKP